FSGYLIFLVATGLTLTLFLSAGTHEWSRLLEFSNFSGERGGNVWPATENLGYLFLLGLLLPAYTITGFDASAHTSEETRDPSRNVPRGMIRSVLYSGIFGWLMLIAILLAAPSVEQAAGQGGNAFFWILEQVLPAPVRSLFYVGIVAAQYLCGLATLTSTSRMFYAFARDGGLPWSSRLKKVSTRFKTPATAIWVAALLSFGFTLYSPVYSTITVVCVIFLYVSYVLPIALGFFAHGRSWTRMGQWTIPGKWFKPVAVICVVGCGVIIYAGVQPPNDLALRITLGTLVLTSILWFGWERRRFQGPPSIGQKNNDF
ncbi:MAG: amino acid permease, partial [Bdellovibrionota bacterium]